MHGYDTDCFFHVLHSRIILNRIGPALLDCKSRAFESAPRNKSFSFTSQQQKTAHSRAVGLTSVSACERPWSVLISLLCSAPLRSIIRHRSQPYWEGRSQRQLQANNAKPVRVELCDLNTRPTFPSNFENSRVDLAQRVCLYVGRGMFRAETKQRLQQLQEKRSNIRNICILAHVDHGAL